MASTQDRPDRFRPGVKVITILDNATTPGVVERVLRNGYYIYFPDTDDCLLFLPEQVRLDMAWARSELNTIRSRPNATATPEGVELAGALLAEAARLETGLAELAAAGDLDAKTAREMAGDMPTERGTSVALGQAAAAAKFATLARGLIAGSGEGR